GRDRNNRAVLISIRCHHVTVGFFCDLLRPSYWIDKFETDEVAGIKPGLNRSRSAMFNRMKSEIGVVFWTHAMISHGDHCSEHLRFIPIQDFDNTSFFAAFFQPDDIT